MQAAESELDRLAALAPAAWGYVRYAGGEIDVVRLKGPLTGPTLASPTEIAFDFEDEVGAVVVSGADSAAPVLYEWRPGPAGSFSVVGWTLAGASVDFTSPGPWAFSLSIKAR